MLAVLNSASLDTQIASNGLDPLMREEGEDDEVTAVMESTRPNQWKDRAKCPVIMCSFESRRMIIEYLLAIVCSKNEVKYSLKTTLRQMLRDVLRKYLRCRERKVLGFWMDVTY